MMTVTNSGILNYTCNRYSCFGMTLIGGRKENQDCLGGNLCDENRIVATVCDGMGGAVGGSTASKMSAHAIVNYLSSPHPYENGLEEVTSSVKAANAAVYQESASNPLLRGMGSTTTVVLLNEEAAYLAHVGDSRIYQIRKGKKKFRTFDHSKVFEMVKAKVINEEQARVHPQSNIITRALGIRPEVNIEVKKLSYKKGDRFVLCCDGVWNSMPESDLLSFITANQAPQDVVRTLTDEVNRIGVETGGHHDNLSVIVIDVNENSSFRETLFTKIKAFFQKFRKK
jgi:protein phosphatase